MLKKNNISCVAGFTLLSPSDLIKKVKDKRAAGVQHACCSIKNGILTAGHHSTRRIKFVFKKDIRFPIWGSASFLEGISQYMYPSDYENNYLILTF